jgi:ribonuclease P protein component
MPLKKNEIILKRLKGRTQIQSLFENGEVYRSKSILLRLEKEKNLSFFAVAIAVSKKNFSRAVDRNYIKRLMRVALKKIGEEIGFSGSCIILYTGTCLPESNMLADQMKELFEKAKS